MLPAGLAQKVKLSILGTILLGRLFIIQQTDHSHSKHIHPLTPIHTACACQNCCTYSLRSACGQTTWHVTAAYTQAHTHTQTHKHTRTHAHTHTHTYTHTRLNTQKLKPTNSTLILPDQRVGRLHESHWSICPHTCNSLSFIIYAIHYHTLFTRMACGRATWKSLLLARRSTATLQVSLGSAWALRVSLGSAWAALNCRKALNCSLTSESWLNLSLTSESWLSLSCSELPQGAQLQPYEWVLAAALNCSKGHNCNLTSESWLSLSCSELS